MSRRVRWALLAGCVAGVLIAATTSGAQTEASSIVVFSSGVNGPFPLSEIDVPVRISGRVVVSFHGDPGAGGCASLSACAESGSASWIPADSGLLVVPLSHGHPPIATRILSLDLGGGGSSLDYGGITTTRTTTGASPGESCVDAANTGEAFVLRARRKSVRFSLGNGEPSLTISRCGAPLVSDLARAFPSVVVPVSRVLGGGVTVSLAGSLPFAAHGFAGTVDSTVRLRLGRPRRVTFGIARAGTPIRVDQAVAVSYRATLRGSIQERFAGVSDPAQCGPLDACGRTGILTVRPGAGVGRGSLQAEGSSRRSRADLLAAVGLRPRRPGNELHAIASVAFSQPSRLDAQTTRGALSCRDTIRMGGGALLLGASRGRLAIGYALGTGFPGTGLHTRCPGPIGPDRPLGLGAVPLTTLHGHTATFHLTRSTHFSDDGYSGSIIPDLTLTLTRGRVRTQRITVLAG